MKIHVNKHGYAWISKRDFYTSTDVIETIRKIKAIWDREKLKIKKCDTHAFN